jgi:hypothetical protein
VKVPYVVVSPKGVANGLSEEYNDGWDFGPDSYNPNHTGSGIPYTQTVGVQEAFNYAVVNGDMSTGSALPIHFMNGDYALSTLTTVSMPAFPSGPHAGYFPTFTLVGVGGTYLGNVLLTNYSFIFGATGQLQVGSGGFLIEGVNFSGCALYFPIYFVENPALYFNRCGLFNTSIYFNGFGIAQISLSEFFMYGSGPFLLNDAYQLSCYNATFKQGLYISNVNQIGGVTLAEGIYIVAGNPIFNLNTWEIDDNGGPGIPIVNNTAGGTTSHAHFEVGTCILSAGTSSSYMPFFSNQLQSTLPNITGFNSDTQGTLNVSIHIAKLQLDGYTDFTVPSGINLVEFRIDSIVNNSGQDISTLTALLTPSLPTNPPVSGTVYQNTNPYDITIDLPVYASTSGTAGTVAYGKSSTSTVTEMTPKFVSGSTSSSAVDIISLRVPRGWYFEFTGSGVTFGTASVFAD